jgi:hypothetical protein
MKILYHIPSLESVYAGRFIYEGYKEAFIKRGHDFRSLTSAENMSKVIEEFNPDIFLYSLNRYSLLSIDLEKLKKYRNKGLIVFAQIKPWKKQGLQFESSDLENDTYIRDLITNGVAGDIFHHWIEQEDECMKGFEENTKKKFHTIILAANTKVYFPDFDSKYKSDICYVGSNLPDKKDFFKERFTTLFQKYDFKVYGSDWNIKDKVLGYSQKAGQLLNIDFLKKIRKIKISTDQERKIYSSSTISLNVHEIHQRQFGSDFNERTFKIIACKGFEIADNVKVLRKYFNEDELVIGENKEDWINKVEYYLKNPDKRLPIIERGYNKVIKEHTYLNRVDQIINIYKKAIKE